ncbi:hypothetical protein Scep_020522 [Stephania cephalantha]|uniref:Apyrase n=1 Tax=Stephania cephalantha TaxID=152367 RepID=A0AAP0NN92_9MAGN
MMPKQKQGCSALLPLLLICSALSTLPLTSTAVANKSYVVIFDAGSSGSRVHVFSFDTDLNLLPIGNDLELFLQTKPGLSAYASDPKLAAASLKPLLSAAEGAVPPQLRGSTPVRVGATAGLRLLKGNASEQILQAVRDLLKGSSALKSKPEWVSVLDGIQEGAFQWVTINYLLGNLGKRFPNTVGVVDLGGGSVQMAYTISAKHAGKAPKPSDPKDSYIKKLTLKGAKYNLYVHSYLNYGLLAARAEILKVAKTTGSSCILNGFHGSYKYGGVEYKASASSAGSDMDSCRRECIKALKINSTCIHPKCTFGGIWNGGGGPGKRNLYVASFFFDRAADAGFIDRSQPASKARPADFKTAADRACATKLDEAKSRYTTVQTDDLPYICMDLVYQFTLLVDGFGLDPQEEITLVKQVKYQNSLVEAAWPLGSAVEAASSPSA